MKKFLTVLLALSVVFTYSFSAVGTAFAADPSSSDAKTTFDIIKDIITITPKNFFIIHLYFKVSAKSTEAKSII